MIVEPDLTSHPKFIHLKSKLGDVAMELLVRLWTHCQQNKRGHLWRGASSDYVEVVCCGRSKKGRVFEALVESGWIHEREDGIEVHDWDKHNASLVARWNRNVKPAQSSTQLSTQAPAQTPDRTGEDLTGQETTRVSGESTHTPAARAPSVAEVREWAVTAGVDSDFAELKFNQAVQRGEFAAQSWQQSWKSKFLRFWQEDRDEWDKKMKKGAPAMTERKEGDADWWHTDSLEDLKGALSGAALSNDEKSAGRLREIIAAREKGAK